MVRSLSLSGGGTRIYARSGYFLLNHYFSFLFQCPTCQKCFTRPGPLNHHIRSVHQGKKTYKCKDCEELFLTKHYLVKHRFEQVRDKNNEIFGIFIATISWWYNQQKKRYTTLLHRLLWSSDIQNKAMALARFDQINEGWRF